MTVQEAIKHVRVSLGGLTQEGLARRMDLTLRTIARYENDSPPKGHALERFVRLAAEAEDWEARDTFTHKLADEYQLLGLKKAVDVDVLRSELSCLCRVISGLRSPSLTIQQARETGLQAEDALGELACSLGINIDPQGSTVSDVQSNGGVHSTADNESAQFPRPSISLAEDIGLGSRREKGGKK